MCFYFLGAILQCEIKILMSIINGVHMGQLLGYPKMEGCGTVIMKGTSHTLRKHL